MVAEIQKRLYFQYNSANYHASNAYIFNHDWESDHFCISKTGYAYEFEIKVSKNDFKKDFEKYKHVYFRTLPNRYVVLNRGNTRGDILSRVLVRANGIYGSYDKYDTTYAEASKIRITDLFKIKIPNRFYFVCPQNIIPVSDVPTYAGLIYNEEFGLKVIKEAPLLHKIKHDYFPVLVKKYYPTYLSKKYIYGTD
jgi:hypothetical protein